MNEHNKKHDYFDDQQANFDCMPLKSVQDNQYDSMIPSKKRKLNSQSYFTTSHKYAGKVKYTEDLNHELESQNNQIDEEEKQSKADNGITQAFKAIKEKRKQQSMILEEDLKVIEKEDQENLIQMRENEKEEGNPEALQNQLNQFSKQVQVRYFSQKNLEELKKYPTNNFPISQNLHELHKQSEKTVLTVLSNLVSNYEHLVNNCFCKQNESQLKLTKYQDILESTSPHIKNKRLNVETLWKQFEEQTKQIKEKMLKQIINWSQRTALLRNPASKSQYNSLLMQTPIGQTNRILQDWWKVSKKCQQKRVPLKILFEPQQNLNNNTDINIYDDVDLLQQIQKIYEQQLDKDNNFLVNNTLEYLEKRSKIKGNNNVDRKASKNRKIRYNVHAKLLNFMPTSNMNLLATRDQIVSNLFNKGQLKEIAQNDYIDI